MEAESEELVCFVNMRYGNKNQSRIDLLLVVHFLFLYSQYLYILLSKKDLGEEMQGTSGSFSKYHTYM